MEGAAPEGENGILKFYIAWEYVGHHCFAELLRQTSESADAGGNVGLGGRGSPST